MHKTPLLDPSWLAVLHDEFQQPYMQSLREFLKNEITAGKKLFPKGTEYFAALNSTPFDKVKVVILGQDPYHGDGQAHGLCFSVREGVSLPPSLVNIFTELKADLGVAGTTGCLSRWAERGVLLLNSVLTVERGQAASHQGKGWERFTDKIVFELTARREGLVFILWGSYAQKKGALVDRKKHFVIESPHPSPLSSYRGFFGSRPFSRANQYLQSKGIKPVDWQLSISNTIQNASLDEAEGKI